MNYLTLSINNIRRARGRAILTALSVAVSAATLSVVLSLDKGYTSSVKSDLVDKTGVHFYITREGCPIEAATVIAQGGLSPLYVREDIVPMIEKLPEVEAVLPFLLFALTTADGSRTDIFMGITESIKNVRPEFVIEKGGWFQGSNGIILGAEMALIEKLNVGDKLYSEHFDKEFDVVGILKRSYSQDDGTFFIPLDRSLQLLSREGKLSAIAVKVKNIETLDKTKTKLMSMIPADHFVLGSKELSDGILQFFAATKMIMFVMVGVAFAVAVFGIINTMLMSVLERKKEIAYLKCVGANGSDLLRTIVLEALLISLVGALIGTLFGSLMSPVFGNIFRGFLAGYVPTGAIAQPDIVIIAISFLLSSTVGVLCAAYPAVKASLINPMEVLRND